MSEGKLTHIHYTWNSDRKGDPAVESLTAGTNRLSLVEEQRLCRDGVSCCRR